jgi:hypothetical protein
VKRIDLNKKTTQANNTMDIERLNYLDECKKEDQEKIKSEQQETTNNNDNTTTQN